MSELNEKDDAEALSSDTSRNRRRKEKLHASLFGRFLLFIIPSQWHKDPEGNLSFHFIFMRFNLEDHDMIC